MGLFNFEDDILHHNKMTFVELQQLQALPIEIKIAKTEARIREFVRYYGAKNIYIAYSGGKDSTVLLHIVRSLYPDIVAVFCNTGCEYPEIIKHVKNTENVIWLKPQLKMKDVIDKYGYPVISKKVAKAIDYVKHHPDTKTASYLLSGIYKGVRSDWAIPKKWKYLLNVDIPISDKCCYILKKQPFNKLVFEARFTGMLAAEGQQRRLTYLKTGCNSFDAGSSMPLGFWLEQDILQYIYKYKLPIADIYGEVLQRADGSFYCTGIDRTGCVGCGFGMHLERQPNRYQRLYYTHPKLWNYYVNTLGFGKVFQAMGVKYMPEEGLLDGIIDDNKAGAAPRQI